MKHEPNSLKQLNPKYTDIKNNFVITRGRGLALPIMQLVKNRNKFKSFKTYLSKQFMPNLARTNDDWWRHLILTAFDFPEFGRRRQNVGYAAEGLARTGLIQVSLELRVVDAEVNVFQKFFFRLFPSPAGIAIGNETCPPNGTNLLRSFLNNKISQSTFILHT